MLRKDAGHGQFLSRAVQTPVRLQKLLRARATGTRRARYGRDARRRPAACTSSVESLQPKPSGWSKWALSPGRARFESQGAAQAAELNRPAVKGSNKKQLSAANHRLPTDEKRGIDAWTAYEAARRALASTGAATLAAAELRAAAVRAKLSVLEREIRRGPNSQLPVPKARASRSIRTVSGGGPGLGRRR